jgi:ribosomal protein S18 acetylase RimI-like enzyme
VTDTVRAEAARGSGAPRLVIQPAGIADAKAILALQKIAYRSEAELYGNPGIPPMTQTLPELRAQFENHVILKASTRRGRIVGSVRARFAGGTCFIGRLLVHPQFQRRGLGTALMAAIESRVPEAERFELFTGHRSAGNLRLYRRLGYRELRRERVDATLELVYLEKPNR